VYVLLNDVSEQAKDGFDRITDVYEVNGAETYRTRYKYDAIDDLVNITDNVGNVFRFEYDSLKRMIGLRDPDLGNWTYDYDASGNMVEQIDARGVEVDFEYDLLNRLTLKDYLADTDVVLTYDVDKVGVLSQADSPAGTVKYAYDNRLRQTAQNYTYGGVTYWIRQAFDALDRVMNVTQSNGEVLTYTYNSGGMLDSIPGYVSNLDYTALGKVANRTYDNGLVSKLSYRSDNFRLNSIRTGVLQNLSYSYDSAGNVLAMNDYAASSLWGYGYDPLDRLVSANESGGISQSFSYNSIGNILSHNNGSVNFSYSYGVGAGAHAVSSVHYNASYANVYSPPNISITCSEGINPVYDSDWNITENTTCSDGIVRLSKSKTVYVAPSKSLSLDSGVLEPTELSPGFILLDAGSSLDLGAGATVYGDDKPNAVYSGTATTGFTYDANGNMVNDSVHVFEYNDDDRMSRVLDQSENLVEEYLYDHGGSRKVKLSVISPELNKTTYYLGKEWIRVEYTNGTVEDTLYVYGNNELLARKDASGDKYYYHPDHLGSTVVTSKQDGSLEERVQYLPYGLPRQQSQEMYQYTSQEWQSDLGFYDYDARQYNPLLMRFMQADNVIQNPYDPQFLNRYSYVRNNPVRYTDPAGHIIPFFIVIAACIVGFGAGGDAYLGEIQRAGNTNPETLEVARLQGTATGLDWGSKAAIGFTAGAELAATGTEMMLSGGETTVAATEGAENAAAKQQGSTEGAVNEGTGTLSPNPNGRHGGELHQQTVKNEAARLESDGHTIKAGGGGPEQAVDIPGGNIRYPDIISITPEGKLCYTNIGNTLKDGITPISRERQALLDLSKTDNIVRFKPKGW
jgi:RHS repeat-associated protein